MEEGEGFTFKPQMNNERKWFTVGGCSVDVSAWIAGAEQRLVVTSTR